jgi:DNA-binding protein H-NS
MSNKIDLSSLDIEALKKLIGDAQKEIERKEKSRIRDIRNRMEKLASEVDMTPEQVLSYEKKAKTTGKPGVPRFRNPDNAKQTWTGRGKRPKWYMDALAKGFTPEQMEIK